MENTPSEPIAPGLVSEPASAAPPADESFAAADRESRARGRALRDGKIAGALALAYLVFYQIAIRLPFGGITVVAITTLISLFMVLAFTVSVARAMRSSRALAIGFLVTFLTALPMILVPLLALRFPELALWKSIGPGFLSYRRFVNVGVPGLGGLLTIWLAAVVGVGIARLVREFNILLPAAVALALVDLYVVFGGGLVTQAESGKAPAAKVAMKALTVNLPAVQPKSGAAPMQLAVGFADFLFIALFFACFLRFGVPSRRTFFVLCGVLATYMIVVAFTGTPLPALVPIAVVVIGMNLRRFHYQRSEAFALLYAGVIVVAILAALVFFSRH